MSGTIPTRYGLKVFVNQEGQISIEQQDEPFNENSIVVVHPEDVPRLVALLQAACEDISPGQHHQSGEGSAHDPQHQDD